MTTSGSDVEGPRAASRGGRRPATRSAIFTSPLSARSIARRDALGPAQLVLVELEGAREEDGVERHAVGGREDLRVDDVAAAPPRRRR